MIRLIATDMDGTLLNTKKEMPADFCSWVEEHPDIRVAIASGRQYYNLYHQFGPVKDELIYIAENGGLAFDRGELLYVNAMKTEDVINCLKIADTLPNVTPILCGAKSAYMLHASELAEANAHMYYYELAFVEDIYAAAGTDQIAKVALFVEDFTAETTFEKLTGLGKIHAVVSGKEWIDLGNPGINKGGALRAIQERYGIDRAETMGFGDYMNDYELLENCGESYAMANACPEIAALAKHRTDSNDNDGVMKILRTL